MNPTSQSTKEIGRPIATMPTQTITAGVVHQVPEDLKMALFNDESALERWEDLTPLSRNEWICWVITTKKPATRTNHIERTVTELLEGVRRPCCWVGCMHRKNNER